MEKIVNKNLKQNNKMIEEIAKNISTLCEYIESNGANCNWEAVRTKLTFFKDDAYFTAITVGEEHELYDKLQYISVELSNINNMLVENKNDSCKRLSDARHFVDTYFYY